MGLKRVEASLSAENTWTDWITIPDLYSREFAARKRFHDFMVQVSGSYVGQITLQARDLKTGNISNADAFDPNVTDIKNGRSNVPREYRAGFDTGQYTSGTANVIIDGEGVL